MNCLLLLSAFILQLPPGEYHVQCAAVRTDAGSALQENAAAETGQDYIFLTKKKGDSSCCSCSGLPFFLCSRTIFALAELIRERATVQAIIKEEWKSCRMSNHHLLMSSEEIPSEARDLPPFREPILRVQ